MSPDEVKMSFLRISSCLETAYLMPTRLRVFLSKVVQIVYFLHQKVIRTSAKMCHLMYPLLQSNTYLSKTIFNHHPFASIHWELLREESDCKAVSQDKVREAAEYCIALHLPGK
ncbi:hypothetical protein ACFX11_001009 [Malus domestica]